MNRMQNFAGTLIVFCTFFFAFVHADDQEDHIALLERAFEAGKKASYCAETEIPSGEVDSIILQPCTLYRSVSPTGELKLRMEIFSKPVWINRPDGQYAIQGDTVGKIFEIPQLWFFEQLNAPIAIEELQNAEFVVEDTIYNKRPCRYVLVKSTSNVVEKQLSERLNSAKDDFSRQVIQEQLRNLPSQLPVRRVFLIDNETNVILARKHYNANGNSLLTIELGNVRFGEQDEALFELPHDATYLESSPGAFATKMTKAVRSAPSMQRKTSWNIWWKRINAVPAWVFFLIGCAALGGAFVHRRWQRNKR